MSKTIQTFLGPATLRGARYGSTKARIHLLFQPESLASAPNGLQSLTAKRQGPAREPNTWFWTISGLRGFPPEHTVAPTSRDALQNYLRARPTEPTPAREKARPEGETRASEPHSPFPASRTRPSA